MLGEPLLLEAAAGASSGVSVAGTAGPATRLPASFGAVPGLDVLAAIDDEVLRLGALGDCALRGHRSLALFINALGDGLQIQKRLLAEVPSRWGLVHLLGLVRERVLHLRAWR